MHCRRNEELGTKNCPTDWENTFAHNTSVHRNLQSIKLWQNNSEQINNIIAKQIFPQNTYAIRYIKKYYLLLIIKEQKIK